MLSNAGLNGSISEEEMRSILQEMALNDHPSKLDDSRITECLDKLLLASTSPASTCSGLLLQVCSIATKEVLQMQNDRPLKTLIRALQVKNMGKQNIENYLKILATLSRKVGFSKKDDIESILQVIKTWLYYEFPPPIVTPTRVKNIGIVGGALSGFSPTKPVNKLSAKSSIAPEAHGNSPDTWALRHNACLCLQSIAMNNPNVLYPYWPWFLPSNSSRQPHLFFLVTNDAPSSTRIVACETMQSMLRTSSAFLSIADDTVSKAAFTPLSATVATIAIELHKEIGRVLFTNIGVDAIINLLGLTCTLASNTAYRRLKTPIVRDLAEKISSFIDFENMSIQKHACLAITSLIKFGFKNRQSKQIFDTKILVAQYSNFISPNNVASVAIHPWRLLTALLAYSSTQESDFQKLFTYIEITIFTVEEGEQEAQLAFLARHSTSFPKIQKNVQALLLSLLESSKISIQLKSTCIDVLATLKADNLDVGRCFTRCFQEIFQSTLVPEEYSIGELGALYRTIGVMVKFSHLEIKSEELINVASKCADASCSTMWIPIQGSTSWAFANCCDLIANRGSVIDTETFDNLLSRCSTLAIVKMESVRIHGIRAIGSLLAVGIKHRSFRLGDEAAITLLCSTVLFSLPNPTVEVTIPKVSPKTAWNAATAISTTVFAIINSPDDKWEQLLNKLLVTLSSCLMESTSYKTRICAATGLGYFIKFYRDSNLKERDRVIYIARYMKVGEAVRAVLKRLEDEVVEHGEEEHAKQLKHKLQELVEPQTLSE